MVQNEFATVEYNPKNILERTDRIAPTGVEQFIGRLNFFMRRLASQCSQEQSVNAVGIRHGMIVGHLIEKITGTGAGGFTDQIAVKHHQRLRDGAIKCGGVAAVVGTEGNGELS